MGCGASAAHGGAGAGGDAEREVAILVHSAKGLREDADILTSCDPYVLCRLGANTADWAAKPSSSERRSETVRSNPNPVWRLAFTFKLLAGQSPASSELHLRVYDRDLLTPDDFLGELRVPLAELLARQNEFRDYPLSTAGKGPATVSVMAGPKVEKALEEELKTAMAQSRLNGWQAPVQMVIDKLGQYFSSALSTPYYWANMVQMSFAWAQSVRDETDSFVEWFRARTKDPKTGEDTYRWSGPEIQNSVTLNGHAEIAQRLEALGPNLGSSDGDGRAFKPNFLGLQALNTCFWPEVPWHGIGLSMPQEAHAWVRPLLTKLSGPGGRWSSQWLENEAARFLLGRESIEIDTDIRAWGSQILHQVFLGEKLTEAEAGEFMAWQKKVLVLIGSPEDAVKAPGLRELYDLDGILKVKAARLQRYKPLLKQVLPEETASMTDEQLTILASVVLDALLFAGGQSVPSAISYALALPYSAWGAKNLPAGFSLHDVSKLPAYIWEVLRRFPPVSGFVYSERSFGASPDERIFLNLHLGQQDPRIWNGADAFRFVLRPLSEYHSKSVGFAEPSVAPRLESPNSHSCPAQDLAFSMVLAFVREFERSAVAVEGGHKALWIARGLDVKDGVHPVINPEEMKISLYGVSAFLLTKDAAAAGPPEADTSGAWILEQLTPEEREKLNTHVQRHNKMNDVSLVTRAFVYATQRIVVPGSELSSKAVAPPKPQSFSASDFTEAPFGGLTFLNDDEDEMSSRLELLTRMLFLAGARQDVNVSAGEEELLWFDSTEEAVASMDATFGPYLPPQYSVWEDMSTDAGMRALCLSGVGAWYLTPARSSGDSGHEVPPGAAFEVNLEYLHKYPARSPWVTPGHTLYLAAPEDGGVLPGPVLGVWSCHQGGLFAPGEELWEVAKAGFRSSLVDTVTLRDHLLHSHWIIGNGLMLAARCKLAPDHPLRRFLKQFYYGTASVNRDSKDALLPLGHFGHRTFPFTDDSWVALFTDLIAAWEWVPFPEKLRRSGLPAPLLEALPMAADGELLWRTIEQHVKAYLAVFYPSEDAALADAELGAFWADFETQLSTPWRLPALSLGTLTTLLTDMIWWVTAGHEFVGSIVEYLSTPLGMASKLAEGKVMPDVQTWTQDLTLIALTGVRMPPLMDDWTHLFQVDAWDPAQRQAALDLTRKFQADLATCSDEIANRNAQRWRRGERKCTAFDPRTLESSVSI